MWTINDVLDSNTRKFSDKEAFVQDDRRLSWGQLGENVRQRAAWLQQQGVGKGDKIAIHGRNSTTWIEAFFAVLKCGGVAVPVNHKLAAAEVEYILADSDSSLWLVDSSLFEELGLDPKDTGIRTFALDTDKEVTGLDPMGFGTETDFRSVDVSADDLAELLYTSGTTGRPKGCMHSHETALLAGIGPGMVWGTGMNDRILMAMPIWHSAPLNNQLLGALYVGATVVLMREYEPVKFLETVQNERCTIFFGAPIAYVMPVQVVEDFEAFDLSSVHAWLYGGGPIDADTAKLLSAKYKSERFYQIYGMTETGPTGTALYPHEQQTKAGSIGKIAVNGCDMRLVNENREDARPGEVGEIWLRAQSMMLGYYKLPEASQKAFEDGWYRTGDLARIDGDGYLFIVDRAKDMIVTGGENVYSKEVEDVLINCPGVNEVAVIGLPHKDWGETVVAVIVTDRSSPIDEEAITSYCKDKLARYKIPRSIQVVDSIPRTPTGKVMKFKVRETFG
ncbi:class I adenylate-forming enzyme family protein [Marinobacter orientalis]|uniref:Long-chain-fatty-acid--CoA ligase n=1 Tax=Marinobacter orientalis TaxID=1928859 RepID=A0A7Y0WRK2_9GAMM|nr:long-chain-fatty-acid--CoA ligase [Marinobacter orientalis]NMT63114.1 long-chain-fatty-acid--CoA ligase [Marinobacter orientalis]TGX51771.1 long-chain-fatty-acid--CoA ligase [Marinobacter orientalis]